MSDAVKSIAVFTRDRFLFQKIRLDAPDGVSVTLGEKESVADLLLIDIDTEELQSANSVTMSRKSGMADIDIPFSLGTVEKLVGKVAGKNILTLSDGERCAYLRGEKIRLTEVEFSLISALFGKGGEFASRKELLEKVWNTETDDGVVNVYIHYLREKLEKHGEKIIISSRKCGYKIDEKYVKGEENA